MLLKGELENNERERENACALLRTSRVGKKSEEDKRRRRWRTRWDKRIAFIKKKKKIRRERQKP